MAMVCAHEHGRWLGSVSQDGSSGTEQDGCHDNGQDGSQGAGHDVATSLQELIYSPP